MRMKALRTFHGKPGENDESGAVRRGHEFEVAGDKRARELEIRGLAIPQGAARLAGKATPEPRPATIVNEAATTGPLDQSAGGETGAKSAPSSSQPDPAPAKAAPTSKRPSSRAGKSSPSTKAGSSARKPKSSMLAIMRGGASRKGRGASKG